MKLLILGGTGLLGVNWAIHARKEHEVVVVTNKRHIEIAGAETIQGGGSEVEDINQMVKRSGAQAVVNCAGITNIEYCERNQERAYFVNGEYAGRVGIACANSGTALIHISTDHLFSDGQYFKKEKQRPLPVNIYGASKLAGERLVQLHNPEALILRTSFFGWGTSYRGSFSDHIIRSLRHRKEVRLYQDVGFNPVTCTKLIEVGHILQRKGKSGVVNVAADNRMTKYEFGVHLAKRLGLDESLIRPANRDTTAVKRPPELSLSNELLRTVVGERMGTVADQIELLLDTSHAMRKEIESL